MKKTRIVVAFLGLLGLTAQAQLKDISFTVSPAAEYTWWDSQAGLEDATLIGGQVGFGFGEYLELRALYRQSNDLSTDFSDFGLTNFDNDAFTSQDVDLTRWGGEFKANIGTKKLKPYLTLGTGVQKLEVDGADDIEQVYASLGLGVIFKLSDRVVFTVEGKNTTFNANPVRDLLTDADKTAFGVIDSDFETDRLSNWSLQGSLQFYLGGRKPGELSDLDEAYLNKFKNGFKGLQLQIEPSGSFISFDDDSLYRDTYLYGGYVGLDFNEYVGIRGFYFQATENERLDLEFDDLSLYGMEFRANLNDGSGVVPYLIIGGGYLNPSSSYEAVDGSTDLEGSAFAHGGLGLTIPINKNIQISTGARAMVTSGLDAEDISATEDIQTNIMYSAGLKFAFGKKAKSADVVYNDNLNAALNEQQVVNDAKLEDFKAGYEAEIDTLEIELQEAYANQDVDKAIEILEEKKEIEENLEEVEKLEVIQEEKAAIIAPEATVISSKEEKRTEKLIRMTPLEFESLIDRILNNLDNKAPVQQNLNNNPIPQSSSQEIDALNKRVDFLEKMLLNLNTSNGVGYNQNIQNEQNDQYEKTEARIEKMSKSIMNKLDDLNSRMDDQQAEFAKKKIKSETVIVAPVTPAIEDTENVVVTTINENGEVVEVKNETPYLTYKNSSAIVGFNVGEATTGNVGIRMHYDMRNTPLEVMPEVYIGFGEETSFGATGNVIYNLPIKNNAIKPYVGAGLGFANIDDDLKGNYNFIIGFKLPFLHKNMYVDYIIRNGFENNQIAIGYHLPF